VTTLEDSEIEKSVATNFNVLTKISIKENEIETLANRLTEHSKILLLTSSVPDSELKMRFRIAKIHAIYNVVDKNVKDMTYIYEYAKNYAILGRKSRGFLYKIPAVKKE